MKTKLGITLAACLLALGLTACQDYSTPEGVAKTAGYAMQKNDFKLFKSTLTGDAAKEFGNPDAFQKLRQTFNGSATDYTMSKPKLLRREDTNDQTIEIYSLTVSDKHSTKRLALESTCWTSMTNTTPDPGNCSSAPGHIGCDPSPPPSESTNCELSEIRIEN